MSDSLLSHSKKARDNVADVKEILIEVDSLIDKSKYNEAIIISEEEPIIPRLIDEMIEV